jgi:hypothetical protein
MKSSLILSLVASCLSTVVLPQEISSTTASILGGVPDGTPPPPSAPKPEYKVSPTDILDTKSHEQGGRTITIRRIKPIALPPPPPVESANATLDNTFHERLAEYRNAHPRNHLLTLGATVFRSIDNPPRTIVRLWPQSGGEMITFWSSADFSMIAGGIHSFVDTEGNRHTLMLTCGSVDIDRMTRLLAAKGRRYDAPHIPEFPAGGATFEIVGKPPAPRELAAIKSLHELYQSEFERLKTAHEVREKMRDERAAHLKANPPKPKDITFNYWRTEKQATSGKGVAE